MKENEVAEEEASPSTTCDEDKEPSFDQYPFSEGEYAVVDWTEGDAPTDKVTGILTAVSDSPGGPVVDVYDHEQGSSSINGPKYDAAPEWVKYSFNIEDSIKITGDEYEKGEPIPAHPKWTVTEFYPNRVEFTNSSGVVVAIEQRKPVGFDLPFRVLRKFEESEEFEYLEESDYFDDAVRFAYLYMHGINDSP